MVCGIYRQCGQDESRMHLVISFRFTEEIGSLRLGKQRDKKFSGSLSDFLTSVVIGGAGTACWN